MFIAFILLLSLLFVLITLRQALTVSIVIKDELYISFDFLFIKFILLPFKNSHSAFSKNQARRDKNATIGKKFNKGKRQLILINEIIKRSDVDIVELNLPITKSTPAEYVLKSEAFGAFLAALIALLKSHSRSFNCSDSDFFEENGTKSSVDVRFKISLFDIVLSLISYKSKQREYIKWQKIR